MNVHQSAIVQRLKAIFIILIALSLSACATTIADHIEEGNLTAARNMIAQGTDVNRNHHPYPHPLWIAALHRNLEAAKMLVDAGADVNLSKALYIAVERNNLDMVNFLLQSGADVNFQDYYGNTPLFHNAKGQMGGIGFKELVEAGADPSIQNKKNETARMWATKHKNSAFINLLDQYQADVPAWEKTQSLDTELAYTKYLSNPFITFYKGKAKKKLDNIVAKNKAVKTKQEKQYSKLKKQSTCNLHEKNWIYTQGQCSGKYGHGQGKAKTISGLTFKGSFKNGYRTYGQLLANGTLMYDGPLKNGKPHGSGICMHKGEPEDCNYYYGKRTDALYKQRIEFSEQRKILMAQQKSLNEKLARLGTGGSAKGKTATDMLTDAAKKKVTDEAVDYLFDKLF
ncbi:MAG: ankyrin repeat domain-containing protein [Bermanella sp.]